MKYYNTMVVFREVPDEITLAINITNCPCKCPSCHSKFLWGDTGTELDFKAIDNFIWANKGISCICFMGGDAEPRRINRLAQYIHEEYPHLKVAWYSGRMRVPTEVNKDDFDYIKVGPYLEHLGPLNKPTTNQRLYKNTHDDSWEDITNRFWKK